MGLFFQVFLLPKRKISVLYTVRIEFSDWHIFPPEFKNKLIVDFETGDIIAKKYITATSKVNIQYFEISEEDIEILLELVSIQKLNDYEQLPRSKKTDMGYRDGWHTDYKIVIKNDMVKTGILSDFYKESPLENVLIYLRDHYPYIEMLRSL